MILDNINSNGVPSFRVEVDGQSIILSSEALRIVSMDSDSPPVFEVTKDGFTICARPYDAFQTAIWFTMANNSYEPETFRILTRFLDCEHSYVDLGGWIGSTAFYGAHRAKHCYVVEPDPVALTALRDNISLNALANLTLYEGAINSFSGQVTLSNSHAPGNSSSSILPADLPHSYRVPCQTLEDFFSANNITDCALIKIDIEGAEALVIPAAKEFLADIRPTIYLSLHTPVFPNAENDTKDILEALSFYEYLYLDTGQPVTPSAILSRSGNFAIVLSDEVW